MRPKEGLTSLGEGGFLRLSQGLTFLGGGLDLPTRAFGLSHKVDLISMGKVAKGATTAEKAASPFGYGRLAAGPSVVKRRDAASPRNSRSGETSSRWP